MDMSDDDSRGLGLAFWIWYLHVECPIVKQEDGMY